MIHKFRRSDSLFITGRHPIAGRVITQRGTHPVATTVIAFGVLGLLALSVACFAAYKIKARRFEFTTDIGSFASLRIMIQSGPEDAELDKGRPGLEP